MIIETLNSVRSFIIYQVADAGIRNLEFVAKTRIYCGTPTVSIGTPTVSKKKTKCKMLNVNYLYQICFNVLKKTILNAHEVVIHVHFLTKNFLFYLVDFIDLYSKLGNLS